MATVEISQPLKWHGGKGYLAARLHALAPPHVHRVHAYAGGLGEFWNWPHEGVSEVVNDVNGWLTNFWDILRDTEKFATFKRWIDATPFSEPIFLAAREAMGRAPIGNTGAEFNPITAAVWFFIVCRQSMAGRMDCFAPLSRNRTRRNMNEQASAWMTCIEGLPAVHARLARVVVMNKDAIEVIKQQDGPNTLFYCDPPYVPESRTSPDIYAHEMTREQHVALLGELAKIDGHFMLSGYDNELYHDFEQRHDWHRVAFDLPNNAAGGDTKRRMIEVVWMNYEPAALVACLTSGGESCA